MRSIVKKSAVCLQQHFSDPYKTFADPCKNRRIPRFKTGQMQVCLKFEHIFTGILPSAQLFSRATNDSLQLAFLRLYHKQHESGFFFRLRNAFVMP